MYEFVGRLKESRMWSPNLTWKRGVLYEQHAARHVVSSAASSPVPGAASSTHVATDRACARSSASRPALAAIA